MKKRTRWSLKAKVMLLSLGMMAAMGFITFVIVLVLKGKQQDLAQANMGSLAQGLGAAVAMQFKQRYGDIQTFASNNTLLLTDQAAIQAVLDKYVELYKIYNVIAMYDIEGNFVAANTKTADGKPLLYPAELKKILGSERWFTETKAQRYSDDKENNLAGTFVEDFQIDPLSTAVYGEPRYGNSFSKAIVNSDGRVMGVLTARADFKYIEAEFQNYYKTISNSGIEAVELTMINSKGQVLIDYDPFYNNQNIEVLHKPDVILSLNLADKGVEAAQSLVAGKSGAGAAMHARKKVQQFVGYASLKDFNGFLSNFNWGILLRAEEESVLGGIYASVRPLYWFAVLSFFVAAIIGFWWANQMSAQLVAVSGKLRAGADDTFKTSEEMQICSRELAVQETIAAMEEMNSMINQSGEYISESLQSAKRVSEKTEEGAQNMRQMVDAMEAIQEANSQLQNMANIINEISAKTNVINSIVFKTQLLSFNASIEAARAGQHGRGFAVVAEEVGNLAQMSGAAAKEIKSLLDDSQKQVLQIVEITRARSTDGQGVSKRAQKTFDEIAQEIKTITSQIESVNDAAREQENGVQQTTVSMSKLDDATTRSARMGLEISGAADNLGDQSRRLNQIMRATMLLVQGSVEKENRKKADYVDQILDEGNHIGSGVQDAATDREVEKILTESAAVGKKVATTGLKKFVEGSGKPEKIISIAGQQGDGGQAGSQKSDDVDADDTSFKKTV